MDRRDAQPDRPPVKICSFDRWLAIALALSAATAGWWSCLALARWQRFHYHAYDLAVIDQVVWNTAHGRWFESSFFAYNFLGQHFQPVLALLAVPCALGAGALALVILQALIAAAAAAVLFLLARSIGLSGPLALALALGYAANPFLHRALDYDFHPETMVALPAFATALAAAHNKRWLAVGIGLTPLLFKEDAVFVTLAVAGFMATLGQRRHASILAGAAFAWSLLLVLVLMPAWRGGAESDLVMRYGYLGDSGNLSQILLAIMRRPWLVLRELGTWENLRTSAVLIVATAPLGLARPWMLTALVPGLALALLSAHPEQHDLQLHYGVELVPVASLISIAAAKRIQSFSPGRLGLAVGACAVIASLWLSPLLPFGPSVLAVERHAVTAEHLRSIDDALGMIPDGAPVSAQSGLAPRLSHRRQLGEFPPAGNPLQWVIVDTLAHRTDFDFDARLEDVRARYTLVFADDGVEVYRLEPILNEAVPLP